MHLSAPLAVPSIRDLKSAYARFTKRERMDAAFFAKTSQWTRFDPRLGEIWCMAFAEAHGAVDLRSFRTEVHAQAFPQAAGVLLAQIRGPEFRAIERYVLTGIRPVPYQDYFVAVSGFASKSVRAAADDPLRSFRRYGFYGREIFRNKARGPASETGSTEVGKATRLRKLAELLGRGAERVTVGEYLAALPPGVSRRVAQLDLSACPDLEAVGSTRGRFYRRRRRAATRAIKRDAL